MRRVEIGEHRAADLLACARRVDDVERSALDTEEGEQALADAVGLGAGVALTEQGGDRGAALRAGRRIVGDADASRSASATGHHTLASP